MNTSNKQIDPRVRRLMELYSAALISAEADRERLSLYMDQYMGSDLIDGSSERAGVVRNITYELIESQINADIPIAKVEAESYSAEGESNAASVEKLCAALRHRLPFDMMNDRDERYAYIYGGSIFYIEWDEVEGDVKLHLLPPTSFIPQPSIESVEDMDYCFLRFTTTRGELIAKYGVGEEEASIAECDYLADLDDPMGDTVAVVIGFYRGEGGTVGRVVFSGELLLADEPNYYSRLCRNTEENVNSACHNADFEQKNDEAPTEGEKTAEAYELVMLPEGGRVRLPYYLPREFPIVLRKNTLGSETLLGGSDCEKIRPQQQAINKVESRILQKLLRSGVTPIMPEGTSVSLSNALFGQVIKTRPGESAQSFGTIDTTPDISQDIEEADRLYDQAKRVLGITDALQGTDATSAESGYARQLKIARAQGRLESKRRMKEAAYARLYRLIFMHYLAFADRPKKYAYRDSFGRIHFSEFNRYDFLVTDGEGGYFYDDSYLFSVEGDLTSGYSPEQLWEMNLTNLERGTLGDKESPATLMRYWQLQDRAKFPYARENVEYFRAMLESTQDTTKGNENE